MILNRLGQFLGSRFDFLGLAVFRSALFRFEIFRFLRFVVEECNRRGWNRGNCLGVRFRSRVLRQRLARKHHEIVVRRARRTCLEPRLRRRLRLGFLVGSLLRLGTRREELRFRQPRGSAPAAPPSPASAPASIGTPITGTLLGTPMLTTSLLTGARLTTPVLAAPVSPAVSAPIPGSPFRPRFNHRRRSRNHLRRLRQALAHERPDRFNRRDAFLHLEDFLLNGADYRVVLFVVFEEIGNIKERVALQSDVHERGLHARKHARHPAFMDAPGEGIFFFALVEDFHQLIVFKDRYFRLMPAGSDDKFFGHANFSRWAPWRARPERIRTRIEVPRPA